MGPNDLIENLDKLHTTALGVKRITKNLSLWNIRDVVDWCRNQITACDSIMEKIGKNWYITTGGGVRITVNAYSYTIITAHKLK